MGRYKSSYAIADKERDEVIETLRSCRLAAIRLRQHAFYGKPRDEVLLAKADALSAAIDAIAASYLGRSDYFWTSHHSIG